MAELTYERLDVPVDGGTLAVGRWGRGGPVVLGQHGITGNHRSFLALAERLGEQVTVLAPDMRGRGASGDVDGPYSMAAHADDGARILDHVGAGEALVVGHSMGGFSAVVMADRHPDRISRLVLLDGGVPLDLPEALLAMPVEDVTRAVIGPALDRLALTFESVEAHRDLWRAHPAMAGAWSRYTEDYFDYDLVGEPPELRSSVSAAAVLADAESELKADDIPVALERLRHPALLVRAEHGLTGDAPLYEEGYAQRWAEEKETVRVTTVAGVNHYTLLLSEPGAAAVAGIVRDELSAAGADRRS